MVIFWCVVYMIGIGSAHGASCVGGIKYTLMLTGTVPIIDTFHAHISCKN